jgi:multicomponent Na+:H+ antiporter subunit E
MIRPLFAVAWLTIVWVALWEDVTWANLVGGAVAGTFVIMLVPLRPREAEYGFRPFAIVRLAVYFAWKLVEASAILAWEVVTPRNRINAAVLAVPLHSRSPRIVTMVANMVSLTPGSLTLEVEETTMTLIIHVLHLESVAESRRSVLYLEQLALAAFPPGRGASAPIQRGAR